MTFFFFLCLLVPGAHSSPLDSLIDVLISCDDTQSALGLACLFYVLLRCYDLLLSYFYFGLRARNYRWVQCVHFNPHACFYSLCQNTAEDSWAHQYFSMAKSKSSTKISNYLKTRRYRHINPRVTADASLTIDDSAFDFIKTSRTSQQMDLQQHHTNLR